MPKNRWRQELLFSENTSCAQINTMKTYLDLNYSKEKACHCPSLWGHLITVQARVLELHSTLPGREARRLWLLCVSQHGLFAAITVQQSGVMPHCFKALEYFFCLLCWQSLHFSSSTSCYATLLLSISRYVRPSKSEFQWAWLPCWCPRVLLLLTLSCH